MSGCGEVRGEKKAEDWTDIIVYNKRENEEAAWQEYFEGDKDGLDEARSMVLCIYWLGDPYSGVANRFSTSHAASRIFLTPLLTAWAPESTAKKDSGCSLSRNHSPSSGHGRLRFPNTATPRLSQPGTQAVTLHAEPGGFLVCCHQQHELLSILHFMFLNTLLHLINL